MGKLAVLCNTWWCFTRNRYKMVSSIVIHLLKAEACMHIHGHKSQRSHLPKLPGAEKQRNYNQRSCFSKNLICGWIALISSSDSADAVLCWRLTVLHWQLSLPSVSIWTFCVWLCVWFWCFKPLNKHCVIFVEGEPGPFSKWKATGELNSFPWPL